MLEQDSYNDLLQSPKWEKRRQAILSRDGQKCRHCQSGKNLQVHHKQYHVSKSTRTLLAPWEYQDQYLITLCISCHQKGHDLYKIPVFTI